MAGSGLGPSACHAIRLLGNYSAQPSCNPPAGVAGKRPQIGRDSECPRSPPCPLWAERASPNPLDQAPLDRLPGPGAAGGPHWQSEWLSGEPGNLCRRWQPCKGGSQEPCKAGSQAVCSALRSWRCRHRLGSPEPAGAGAAAEVTEFTSPPPPFWSDGWLSAQAGEPAQLPLQGAALSLPHSAPRLHPTPFLQLLGDRPGLRVR